MRRQQPASESSELSLPALDSLSRYSDGELVAAYRHGTASAFDELYRRHSHAVRAVCLATVRDPDVADDLVQEVFVRLLEQLPRLHGDQVLNWLRRVAKNVSIDDRRRFRNTELPLDTVSAVVPDSRASFDDAVVTREAVWTVLQRLRPAEAALLRDHHLDDQPLRLMAAAWNSTEKSLSVRLTRARRAFATAAGQTRMLVLLPVLWRLRNAAQRHEVPRMASAVGAGVLQLAVVAAMSLPTAVVASPQPPSAEAGRASHTRVEMVSGRGGEGANTGRQRAETPPRQRRRTPVEPERPAPAPAKATPERLDVAVPGTSVRVHQEKPQERGFRYQAGWESGPVGKQATGVETYDAEAAEPAQSAACPLVNRASTILRCTRMRGK